MGSKQLGKFDGRAYETLLERAQNDLNLNAGDEDERKKMCVLLFVGLELR